MPIRPEEIIKGKNTSHFSIHTDGSYNEYNNVQDACKATDLIAISIQYNYYDRPGYRNEYFQFEIFNNNRDSIHDFTINGWRLKFGGPIMDRGWFNQYRTFICSIASPSDPEEFIHVENLYIGIDDFVKAVKRIKSISERNNVSLSSELWKVEMLNEEIEDLERKREELWENNRMLKVQLDECTSKSN